MSRNGLPTGKLWVNTPPSTWYQVSSPTGMAECYLLPGWYSPGTQRNVIASRFHPLMAMIVSVRFANSSSEKLFLAF